ncbi:MAG: C39 family peptidase [Pirellulales bacterium]|nr:C39 family peptidase [Pirellulales bacterium]
MHARRLIVATPVVLAALIVAIFGAAFPGQPKKADQDSSPKAADPAPSERLADVLIRDVPHIRQKPDFCGEACAAMFLRKLGQRVDQDYVFDCAGLDPMLARGCHTRELAAALKTIGFRAGPVWYQIPAAAFDDALQAHWKALHADLAAGVPSIVCTHYDERPGASEHFRLVLGYDAASDQVIYHEPAEADGTYRRMERATLLKLWPLKYDAKQWTLIRLRLEPGQLRPGEAAETFTAADYAQHLMQLGKRVPRGFTVVIQHPFVVVGDESPAVVKRRAEGTVKWAVDRLKQAYFTKDPTAILDIWLFKDDTSYRKHCKSIFNHDPSTPFGYYSHAERSLIMNIATGGGTLVHEIVHPFVAANFPECPAWMNEGLGSLYEQSASREGRIVGLTNWRLAGLQEAIRRKQVPSFKTLCSTTDTGFYRMDKGTNYAQARYLCYYLQEHGLLETFYRRFHADHQKDPTGYETLRAVLDREDMAAFQKQWEAYVLELRFP